MENYNISFLGKNKELFSFIKECLDEFEFNFSEAGEWNDFKKITAIDVPSLIMLSSDTEHLVEDEEFNKFRMTSTGKIPVFSFSKNAAAYKETASFKEKLIANLKKSWAENVLPRKQVPFEPIKMAQTRDNKRKYPRVSAKTPVEIEDPASNIKLKGTLRNLSTGGISVKTEKQIGDGEFHLVSFSLEEGKTFNLRSVKIRDSDMGEHWHTAFRFDDISFEDSDAIDEYTENLIVLRKLRVFSEFQDEELLYILRTGKKLNITNKSVIFSEGSSGKDFYVVFDGKIKISKMTGKPGEEKEKFLAFIYPGEFFGEMAILKEIPRTGSAQAVADSILFRIGRDSLENLLTSRADIAVKFYRSFISALIERLRLVDQELIDSPFTKLQSITQF